MIKIKLSLTELNEFYHYLESIEELLLRTIVSTRVVAKQQALNATLELVVELKKNIAKKLIDKKANYTIKLLQVQGLLLIKYYSRVFINNTYTRIIIQSTNTTIEQQLINKL